MLEEQTLDSERHDRAGFSCGEPELDAYLAHFAGQHVRKGISSVYVLVDSDQPNRVLGYYSLSAAQVDVMQLSPTHRKKLPGYPVPCFRMGRLACRLDQRGIGLGQLLMGCSVERCLHARKQVAAMALLVDAKNPEAAAFYMHYGFTPCTDSPLTVYLPLG